MSMRPIRLPEPPSASSIPVPEIFDGAVNVIRRAVIIGNGFPGAENQCLGLIRALGLANHHSIHRVIRPRGGVNEWLRWLPVSLHNLVQHILLNSTIHRDVSSILHADATNIAAMARESFEKEGPLLIVASGRDTISLASSIKRLAPENVFVVQIQHPRTQLERFDLVVTPKHDYYALTSDGQQEIPRILRRWITPQEPPSKNVVLTVGALHQADSASLRIAAATWHDELAPLPKPLLVVNIGGPTRNCRYGADLAIELVGSLHNILPSCGSVRISFSRRTPQMVSETIIRELGDHPKIYIWDNEGPNPHMGHLAWADAFVITADSISMLSEACSTGKPVYVIGSERCRWKFLAFHKTLRERGVVRPFTGLEDISNSWSYPPLNDAAEAAARVREVLAERGWSIRH